MARQSVATILIAQTPIVSEKNIATNNLMTQDLRNLIETSAADIVKDVDARLLTVSKRQAVEKRLEKFYQSLAVLDEEKDKAP